LLLAILVGKRRRERGETLAQKRYEVKRSFFNFRRRKKRGGDSFPEREGDQLRKIAEISHLDRGEKGEEV